MLSRRWASLIKLVILLAFVAGAVFFFRGTEAGRAITPHAVKEYIERLDPVAARLLYIGIYIIGTVLLIPGVVLSFGGAVLFGPYEGTLYTWIGATIGATLAFLAARWLGRDFVNQRLGGRLAALDERLRQHGFTSLLILRLVPLFPFNGLNFGCGLTSIRLRDYVLATAIGIIPFTFVYQFLFANLGRKMLEEGFAWSDLLDWQIGLALGLFVVALIGGKWLANKLNKPSPLVAKDQSESSPPLRGG